MAPAGSSVMIAAQVLSRLVAAALLFVLHVYKRLLSPLVGPSCRFHPTCSTYAMHAIRRHGPIVGTTRALARLARCHPFSEGGYDPVR